MPQRTSPNGRAKLDEHKVAEIKARLKRNEPYSIAEEYGVSRAAILQIDRGTNWAWVKPLPLRAIRHIPIREAGSSRVLLDIEIAQIKRRLEDGEKPGTLAYDYGVSEEHIREIRRGARHAHIRPARSFDGRLPRPERAGRFVRRSYAPRPDARGEANARARLTEHDALELLVRMLEGESPQIAEEYGVTRSAANEIKHGRAWWHLRDQLPPRLRRKHDELIDVKFHERRLRRARRRTQL